jgi:deoxyribodipyrimidine photo-lyase
MHTTLLRFRQDLRLQDNTALLYALNHSTQIVPVFIFDTDVLQQFPEHDARLGFVIEAVQDLERQLQAA